MTKTRPQKQRAARRAVVNTRRNTVVKSTVSTVVRKPKQNRSRSRMMTVSKCCADYIRAIENPFSGISCCVPGNYNQPSRKANLWVKGTFSTGPTGFGCVVVNPQFLLFNNNSGGADANVAPVISTTNSYASTNVPTYNYTNVLIPAPNSPYDGSTGALRARLVACGVRVRNITPLMYRGGQVLLCESPTHGTLGNVNFSYINSFITSGSGNASGSWSSVVWHPMDSDEQDWRSGIELGTNIAPGQFSTWSLVAAASSTSSQAQIYEYQVYAVAEYVGADVTGITSSPSDVQGMSHVNNAMSSVESRRPHIGDREPVVQNALMKAALENAKMVGSAVGVVALNSIGRYAAARIGSMRSSINPAIDIMNDLD